MLLEVKLLLNIEGEKRNAFIRPSFLQLIILMTDIEG